MHIAMLVLFAALEPMMFGPGGSFQLERSKDGFGMRSHGIVETLGPNRTKFYPLPQSTAEKYVQLRPEDLRVNPFAATANHYDRQEVIGPHQIEHGRLWFGNSYYDGEGMRGVGAFGYFDTSTREYTLFSPPAVARYEISAILVEPNRIWVALDRFGEDISTSPGGLVRWSRTTHAVQIYRLEFVIGSIRTQGDSLRLGTQDGYALFRNGELHRFLANGKSIARFPPPPSHY